MDANRFTRWLISCSTAALLCGCGGGGGGGSAALPPVPASTPGMPSAGAPQSVPFSIALPSAASASTSSGTRRPRYVSAGTKSATIAYAGETQTINCTSDACSGLLVVAPGQVTFVATLFDQTNGTGNRLAQGQISSIIVAGQSNNIHITFGGVVASVVLALSPSSVPAGTAASVPVTVTPRDAAGYTIVGSAPFTSPIVLTSDDASGATSLSATSLAAPGTPVALAYTGNGGPAAVHLTARAADAPGSAGTATLAITAKPSPAPSATPTPAPVPVPTQNPRSVVWSIGDTWGLPSTTDGQGSDVPVFSQAPAACVREQTSAQCSGGSGAVSFHVQRADTTTVPAAEYRNMMVLQKWDPAKQYAFNYELIPNGVYDVRFQTVNHMKDDAQNVQSLLWQNHAGDGSVMTGLGMINTDGKGNRFFFNAGAREGGTANWYGTAAQGAVDTWEIQFRNSQDATGWVDMYHNGTLQVHYTGPVVNTTSYDLMSFGIYYYNWEIKRSTILSTDITFNYFELSTIPGPVAPAPYGS